MLPYANDTKDVDNIPHDYTLSKVKWYDQILQNRPLQVIILLSIIAILAPSLIYHYLFFQSLDLPPTDGYSVGSCLLPRSSRLLCGLGNVTQQECHQQCCYDLNNNLCFHRLPSRFSYLMDVEWAEEVVLQPRVSTVPFKFQSSLTNLRLSIDEVNPSHLGITYYDPRQMQLQGNRIEQNKTYTYQVTSPELNVIVNSTKGTIFKTVRGPLIASENIWEIAFKLTDETMYGLGEIPLLENTVKMVYNHDGGLSSLPLIFARLNGSYHGLLIDINNPTEVHIQSDDQIVVRSITNSSLSFRIFLGPTPKDVMEDVIDFIGAKKVLEYWMLGAHMCTENAESGQGSLSDFFDNASSQGLPFDSHCGAGPIVVSNVCGADDHANAELVRGFGKRFVPHLAPYIILEKSVSSADSNSSEIEIRDTECTDFLSEYSQLMIQDPAGQEVYRGQVGDDDVMYPDYSNVTDEFMRKLLHFRPVDGVVLENTWPLDHSNKTHVDTYLMLPYFSKNFEKAFSHTPQWNATFPSGDKYLYHHILYANHFIDAIHRLNNTTVYTTTQWLKGDVAINRQNINASWTNFNKELIEAALGGVSGQWLWSSPICGDTEHFDVETQSSLCVKWYSAATFMPLIKIHSKTIERHPLSFGGTHRTLMIEALRRRMSLLPYFYTVLQSGPLLRPMFYQYPLVVSLQDLTSQYSVGDDILVVPNLQPSQSHVHVRMPPGSWYEMWSGLKLDADEGEAVTMATTEADFLTLIRGSAIVAVQKDVRQTAEETRLQSSFSLIVALDCETENATQANDTSQCTASGVLFIAENYEIHFVASSNQLNITSTDSVMQQQCSEDNTIWSHKINEIDVYGLDEEFNNYDHHRHIVKEIDLCDLLQESEIILYFNET